MIPKFRLVDKVKKEIWNVESISWDFGVEVDFLHVDAFNDVGDIKTFSRQFELLQSTGLFDLDGNEIYIGDILKMEDEYTQVVFHEDNTTYGVYLEDKEGGGNPISDYSTRISLNHIKGTIEGNKYEHPHLLEE